MDEEKKVVIRVSSLDCDCKEEIVMFIMLGKTALAKIIP
jgi:hypothetical protein